MTENRDDVWNDEDEDEAPPGQGGGGKRFLAFLLTLVLVLGVVTVAAWRDGTGFDVLRRWFHYSSAPEEKVQFTYDADRDNRFAALGKSLVVASDTNLSVLSGSETIYSETVQMEAPSLRMGKNLVAVADAGGTHLTVLSEKGKVYELETSTEEAFLAATLNRSDWLAVTQEKRGLKGAVSVYDAEGKLRFTFNSSDRFVTDACVSNDNKYLAAVTLGQADGVFLSNIVIYPLDSTEPTANYNISNALVLEIGTLGNFLATISDTCLTLANTDGEVSATYPYSGYLREYDLGGNGYATLLLNRYKSGSAGRLVTVDASGEELGSVEVQDEVLGLSASGGYVAVLYSDSLVVYTADLLEYARLDETAARDALMRSDGSVLILGAEQGTVYLP